MYTELKIWIYKFSFKSFQSLTQFINENISYRLLKIRYSLFVLNTAFKICCYLEIEKNRAKYLFFHPVIFLFIL